MSTTTLAHPAGTDRAPKVVSSSDVLDPRTDDGLRQALLSVEEAGSWETPPGRHLIAEIRRRAVRNAAHVAAATDVAMGRGLVDDVLLAAWMVLCRHSDKVFAAGCPWAYLMSSAQKHVLDEVRAQQLLTNTASIRGRAREALPSLVRPVGATASDLATALRHEPSDGDAGDARRIVRQVRQHEQPPLVAGSEPGATPPLCERESWFTAFIDLLVTHGADQAVTVTAVDRLSDLFPATYVGWWEWAAPPRPHPRPARPEPAPVRRPRRLARRITQVPAQRQTGQPARSRPHRDRARPRGAAVCRSAAQARRIRRHCAAPT